MGLQVDCWAAGVLAYELVVGRPPFEVKDEAKTAAAIMYKNDIVLPAKYSTLWADFVKQVVAILSLRVLSRASSSPWKR